MVLSFNQSTYNSQNKAIRKKAIFVHLKIFFWKLFEFFTLTFHAQYFFSESKISI